jgi:hypothetical protein
VNRGTHLSRQVVRAVVDSGEVIGLAARFAVRNGISDDVAVTLFRCALESERERVARSMAPTEPPPPTT